jgi:DNA (cytosine-5)-methyltransferase 1
VRVLDLFSGIGGFSIGLEAAGFETVAFCEVSPVCRHLLAHHWPKVPCYDDIRTLTAERLAADGIGVDVICGGFPCQDLSYAGKGAGLAGERSGLWRDYARLVRELRPKFVIVENVSALLGRGLGDVLGDLAALGYDAWWDCIPASAVGAPHRRDRLWIIAYARSEQHEGYGLALRRAVASELSRAALADASRQLRPGRRIGAEQDGRSEPTDGGSDVGNANRKGLSVPRIARGSCSTPGPVQARRASDRAGWWSTEPDVGRTLDGFSRWLDESYGDQEAHKVIMAYANASNAGPREALRNLRDRVCAEDNRRKAGGPIGVSASEVLFAFVREHARRAEEGLSPLESTAPQADGLRGVWREEGSSRSPLRPERDEQRSDEPSDPLQVVSQLLARHAEAAWVAYRWPDAWSSQKWVNGWEDGIARVATGVTARAHRLHGLGNAVVPQIPEMIGRAIMASLPPILTKGQAA